MQALQHRCEELEAELHASRSKLVEVSPLTPQFLSACFLINQCRWVSEAYAWAGSLLWLGLFVPVQAYARASLAMAHSDWRWNAPLQVARRNLEVNSNLMKKAISFRTEKVGPLTMHPASSLL